MCMCIGMHMWRARGGQKKTVDVGPHLLLCLRQNILLLPLCTLGKLVRKLPGCLS